MTDERLIEAARVAFVEAWEAERKKIGQGIAEPGTKTRAGIIAALAVFEKAHAPTDDEQEALWDAFDAVHRVTEGGCDTRGKDVADMVLGLGFRRPEVPEPSAENGTPRDYQAYELTVDMLEDLLVTAGVSASEHGIAIRKTAGALVYKIGRCLAPEPQGESSDAQVEAAMEAYAKYRESDGPGDAMRAALRAAGEVNPSVGEKPL